jgi:hypothetical protein
VGYQRIIDLDTVVVDEVRVEITDTRATPILTEVAVLSPETLREPTPGGPGL